MGCSVGTLNDKPYSQNKTHPEFNNVKCDPINENNENNEGSNEIVAHFPKTTQFDPRIPLTGRQRFNISKSWKGIARNMEQTGINMFLRLFETNEEIQLMFKGLHGYTSTELRASKGLENHVSMVMYTLDEAISSLEDVDFVVEMLHNIGHSHWEMKIFNPDIFWKIEEPFLLAVKETLGDRYSANMDHIYKKTIKFILETLIEGFRLSD